MDSILLYLPLCFGAVLVYRTIWSPTAEEGIRTSVPLFLKMLFMSVTVALVSCLLQYFRIN